MGQYDKEQRYERFGDEGRSWSGHGSPGGKWNALGEEPAGPARGSEKVHWTLSPAALRVQCFGMSGLVVISNQVVHSEPLQKNGGYHTNPASGEEAPSDDSS